MRFAHLFAAGAALAFSVSANATVIEGFAAPTDGVVTLSFNQLFPVNGQTITFQLELNGGTVIDASYYGGGQLRLLWWEQAPGEPQPHLWGNEYMMPIGCTATPGNSCTDNFVRITADLNRVTGISAVPAEYYNCDTVKIIDRICGSRYEVGAIVEANIASDTGVNYRLTFNAAAVPEPATWAMMIAGFGLLGAAVRRKRTQAFIDSLAFA